MGFKIFIDLAYFVRLFIYIRCIDGTKNYLTWFDCDAPILHIQNGGIAVGRCNEKSNDVSCYMGNVKKTIQRG